MKKGEGFQTLLALFFMSAAIISGFIVGPIGTSPDTSDLIRILLALIPLSLFLVAFLLIWIFSNRTIDEMQDVIRMRGMLYGWAFSFIFFMAYGTFQLMGLDLPSFTGLGAVWIIGISVYLGKFIAHLRYR